MNYTLSILIETTMAKSEHTQDGHEVLSMELGDPGHIMFLIRLHVVLGLVLLIGL